VLQHLGSSHIEGILLGLEASSVHVWKIHAFFVVNGQIVAHGNISGA
jgi:hypothetical protein